MRASSPYTLDPVTFEVLKNSFISIVDQMAEQILRTCHSFVIFNRDFSSALCDADGDTIAQGTQDIASHVGTLHFTAKAVIEAFEGGIHPGDVYMINDPYAGGTHFSDVRIVRPIFVGDELIAYSQSNGHWADLGGSVPGSFDIRAKDMFGEAVRIPPVRLWDRGSYRADVGRLVAENTRDPAAIIGDMHAQAAATAVAEREVLRLVDKYGKDTVVTAFQEVQDYVERVTRQRIAELPDGVWETIDYLDCDPSAGEGMLPIPIRMEIKGDRVDYDFTGTHPAIRSLFNSSFGGTFAGIVSGMKTFFPDVPLNSGFYRAITVSVPDNTLVSARWPFAVTGFLHPMEKIVNSIFELWSRLMPERAIACAFNTEYLLMGGHDTRRPDKPFFMLYDWLAGGWGGRNGKDGIGTTSPPFGVGLMCQPVEGQERLCPVLHSRHEIMTDSAGPGRCRGGMGVIKSGTLGPAEGAVVSYVCDRERSVVWGLEGGLPSYPHGLWLHRGHASRPEFLGAKASNVEIQAGDVFSRPSAGGGGFGDPLERDPALVCQDVTDGYVSIERAAKDYGVIVREVDADLAEYEVDSEATAVERVRIEARRHEWLGEDPESVAARYRAGELDIFDLVRQYGVIVDWGSGELFTKTTKAYRDMLVRRSAACWKQRPSAVPSEGEAAKGDRPKE